MPEKIIINNSAISPNIPSIHAVSSGRQLEEFIEYEKNLGDLNDKGALNLRNSTCEILSFCNRHDDVLALPTTHLVVGYVQSGKTMSFTSLIKLAADYKYRVVVVFAGITNNLLDQTSERLEKDLLCDNHLNRKIYKFLKNPDISNLSEIKRYTKIEGSILILPILKHYDRIDAVNELLTSLSKSLVRETVLIIDDEADQASLNNFGRKNSGKSDDKEMLYSRTYESILNLRNSLPGNSYVQYTATPQANVLIDSLDILSPKTHTLLIPGDGYCGGKLFFGIGDEGKEFGKNLIVEIDKKEVFNSKVNPLQKIPKSLEDALMLQIIAVAIVIYIKKTPKISQLSMLVHTDSQLVWNATFKNWIEDTLNKWSELLELKPNDVHYRSFYNCFFKNYNEAIKLYEISERPSIDEVYPYVYDILNDSHVYLVTGDTDDSKKLRWEDHVLNILVGAQMLNRGFTVKNLTVTYMPRYTMTVTNADTIEQRCRFFGYKRSYIKSCRVFLPKISIENYENYIVSEEELREAMSTTNSMNLLGHKILSSQKLRPTRQNVLPKSVVTQSLKGNKELSPYYDIYLQHNLDLCDNLINDNRSCIVPFVKDGYNANDFKGARKHESFFLSVDEAIQFLRDYKVGSCKDLRIIGDTIRYLCYLKADKKISNILFVNMACGNLKERPVNLMSHCLNNSSIFEGPSSAKENSNDRKNYIGDSRICSADTITIQIHHIKYRDDPTRNSATIAINYPTNLSVTYCNSF